MGVATLRGTFTKLDDERRQAFGWAYVTHDEGQQVVDHSEEFIDEAAFPSLEKAAYDYVLVSREADEMHERFEDVAKVIESFVLTPEKATAMGIVTKRFGWWIGFQIIDTEVWKKVKDGTYPAFSIRGAGQVQELAA